MNTAILEDLAMQGAETLRRAAERSVRRLNVPGQGDRAGQELRGALRDFVADCRADLVSLGRLRETADKLLREGMEAEGFLRFCEVALEAAEITMKGAVTAQMRSESIVSDSDGANGLAGQIKESSEQAQSIHSYFRRLVEWLRTPPLPLAQAVLQKLDSLPPVVGSETRQ